MSDESPTTAWEALRSAGLVRHLADGETLFRAGDDADGAYVLLDGACVVIEDDEVVSTLRPGDLFGEIATVAGGSRTASVVAIDGSELLFLSMDELREGFARSPELFWQALRVIVSRLQVVTHRQQGYRSEHRALQDVQRSLLPDLSDVDPDATGFEAFAMWEPCTYASGDFWDVIRLDDHRHLVAVGDVMGHGAEASLMMAIARAQLRELARGFRRTDELLLNLDGYLRDNAPPKQGMSLVVAVHDRRERVLEYGLAGHPAPMLWRDGEVSDLPGRQGILLGLPFLVGTGYERREVELRPGDVVLLFTDGWFEVPVDPAGCQLGRAGLAGLFGEVLAAGSAVDPVRAIAERIAALDVGDAPDDDRTALLLRIR